MQLHFLESPAQKEEITFHSTCGAAVWRPVAEAAQLLAVGRETADCGGTAAKIK